MSTDVDAKPGSRDWSERSVRYERRRAARLRRHRDLSWASVKWATRMEEAPVCDLEGSSWKKRQSRKLLDALICATELAEGCSDAGAEIGAGSSDDEELQRGCCCSGRARSARSVGGSTALTADEKDVEARHRLLVKLMLAETRGQYVSRGLVQSIPDPGSAEPNMLPSTQLRRDNRTNMSRWDHAVALAAAVAARWQRMTAPVVARRDIDERSDLCSGRMAAVMAAISRCQITAATSASGPFVSIVSLSGRTLLGDVAAGPQAALWSWPHKVEKQTGERIALLCPSGLRLSSDSVTPPRNLTFAEGDAITLLLGDTTDAGRRNQQRWPRLAFSEFVVVRSGGCKIRLWREDASCQWLKVGQGARHLAHVGLCDGHFAISGERIRFQWETCVSATKRCSPLPLLRRKEQQEWLPPGDPRRRNPFARRCRKRSLLYSLLSPWSNYVGRSRRKAFWRDFMSACVFRTDSAQRPPASLSLNTMETLEEIAPGDTQCEFGPEARDAMRRFAFAHRHAGCF